MSRLAWNSVLVTCLNGLTLVAGLVVYPFIAAHFSPQQTDAFFLALTIPWLIIGPVMNAVSSTLIPVIAECRFKRPEGVSVLVGSTIAHGIILSLIAGSTLVLLTPVALRLTGSTLGPEETQRVVSNTFLLLPLVVLQTVTAVLDAASNSAGCFWLPASAALIRQLVTLASIAVLAGRIGAASLAVGFTLGATAHLFLLVMFWRRTRVAVRLTWKLTAEFRTAVRLAIPLLVSTAVLQVIVLLSRFLAARLPSGSVTALDYAYRITNALVDVTSSGVLLVLLADWSKVAVHGTPADLRQNLGRAIPLILFVLLPPVFVLYAVRGPVIELWLGIARVSPEFIGLVAATLGMCLIGIPLDIAARVYVRLFLVSQRTSLLAYLAIGRLVVSAAAFTLLLGYVGLPAIPIGDNLGILFTLVGLVLAAKSHLIEPVVGLKGTMLRLVAIAVAAALAASLLSVQLAGVTPLVRISIVTVTGTAVYIALAWLLKSEELKTVRSFLQLRRPTAARP